MYRDRSRRRRRSDARRLTSIACCDKSEKMSVWSFYDSATGLFSGRRCSCSSKLLAMNTPAGYVAIEGIYDRLTQRVDLDTGTVVVYERPASEIAAEQKAARQQQARQRIDELELAQLRP